MNRLIVAAIRCSLTFILPTVAYSISAQWDLDPISGDWNTAANWTPPGVPNGPADVATFGLSNTTNVSISANTEVTSIIFTPAATNPYTITASPGLTLTISGVGINSGTFVTASDGKNDGQILFTNTSTAGSSRIFNEGGSTNFFNTSTAGTSEIDFLGRGSTNFFDSSTAGYTFMEFNPPPNTRLSNHPISSIEDETESVNFLNNSTAANAFITIFEGGSVTFSDNSNAGNLYAISQDGAGYLSFFDNSSAGSATWITDELSYSQINFSNYSTAANATIIGSFGPIDFSDFSTAGSADIQSFGSLVSFNDSSTGGRAQIDLKFNGGDISTLDISGHNAPGVTIGSLKGEETEFVTATVTLGVNNLTVGSNNLSTTFPGVIDDGGLGGSLTKIGTGTLALSGANTYTGNTNINRGALQVDGFITSDTFVNPRGALSGNGTVNGNVTNNHAANVSPGDALGVPGVLTVGGNYTQAPGATLLIQIAGADAGQVSVLNVLGNANLNGYLDPVLVNGFVPDIGQSFTFMNYASFTGFFSHIKDQPFDNGRKRWLLVYYPASAVLFVVKNGP